MSEEKKLREETPAEPADAPVETTPTRTFSRARKYQRAPGVSNTNLTVDTPDPRRLLCSAVPRRLRLAEPRRGGSRIPIRRAAKIGGVSESNLPAQSNQRPEEPTNSHSPADERIEIQPQPPEESAPTARAIASAEDQPHDPTPAPRACTVPEESTQSRKKGAEWPPHPLWRGWWLAVVLLASIVVLGQEPPRLSDWVNPPLRPFAGGILLGCALGALPRVLRKRGGEAS